MTNELWTAAGIVVSLIGSGVIPLVLQRRKTRADSDVSSVMSWRGLAEERRVDRDAMQEQLNSIEERHRETLREVEADWSRRLGDAQKRIADLEAQVATLKQIVRGHGDNA